MNLKHLSSTKLSWTVKNQPYRLKYFYKKLFLVNDRYLICVSNLGECLCFDMAEKKVVWVDMDYHKYNDSYSFVTHEHTVLHKGIMFSGRDDKDFAAQDIETGKILWKFYAGSGSDTFNSNFSFHDGKVLFHSKRSTNCVDMESHKLVWKLKFTADLGSENGVVWNNYYIVQSVSRNNPTLNYINIDTGEVERQIKLTSEYSDNAKVVGMSYADVFPWGDQIWYKSRNGHICCIDLVKGERIEVAFKGCGCTDPWAIGSADHIILNDKMYMLAVGGGLEHGWYKFGQDMQLELVALTADANMSGFGSYSCNYRVTAFTDRDTSKSRINILEVTTGEYQSIEIHEAKDLKCAMLYGDKLILTDCTGDNGEATIHIFLCS